jgi:hypothetical protein
MKEEEKNMNREKIVIEVTDPQTGDLVETVIPSKFEVCGRCEGRGTHCNPAIDGNGLSREDFDQDPDFEEAYFRGDYDVLCEECHGNRVTLVADWAKMDDLTKKLYEEHLRGERMYRAEMEAERRMGA